MKAPAPPRASCTIWVRVKPRARRDGIVGWNEEGYLEIELRALPQKGEANRSCCRVLARALGIPASGIRLDKGQTSPHKKLVVEGVSRPEVERLLSRNRSGSKA